MANFFHLKPILILDSRQRGFKELPKLLETFENFVIHEV